MAFPARFLNIQKICIIDGIYSAPQRKRKPEEYTFPKLVVKVNNLYSTAQDLFRKTQLHYLTQEHRHTTLKQAGMVAQAFDSSSLEAEAGRPL